MPVPGCGADLADLADVLTWPSPAGQATGAAAAAQARAAAKQKAAEDEAAAATARKKAEADAEGKPKKVSHWTQRPSVNPTKPSGPAIAFPEVEVVDLDGMAYFKLKKWIKAHPKAKTIPKEKMDTAFGKPELLRLAKEYGLS